MAAKSTTFAEVVLSVATFPAPTALTATATSSAVVASPCSLVAAATAAANSTIVVYSAVLPLLIAASSDPL